jgi:hypothetical protein
LSLTSAPGAQCAFVQVIQDFADDNCVYLELRTTPKVQNAGGMKGCELLKCCSAARGSSTGAPSSTLRHLKQATAM